jgi:hypothetical protein
MNNTTITANMKPNHMDFERAREYGKKVAHAKARAREAMATKFDKANRVWFSIEDCDALMDEMRNVNY